MKNVLRILLVTVLLFGGCSKDTPTEQQNQGQTSQQENSITSTANDKSKSMPETPLERLLKKANTGDMKSQFSVGWIYYSGEGVSQDYEQAANWYQKAAEQGYTEAQYNLGVMYYSGEGVSKDYKKAIELYRKAAEQEHAKAEFNLGWMYYSGEGVVKDYKEAYRWILLSGTHGHDISEMKTLIEELMTPEEKIAEIQKVIDSFDYQPVYCTINQNPGDGYLYCVWLRNPSLKGIVPGGEVFVVEIGDREDLMNCVDNTVKGIFVKRDGVHRYETVTGSLSTVEKYKAAPTEINDRIEELLDQAKKISGL